MDSETLRHLLEQFRNGALDLDTVVEQVAFPRYENLGHARVDHERALRQGVPEVVFGEGKTPDQIEEIMQELLRHSPRALATRVSAGAAAYVRERLPDASYCPLSRVLVVDRAPLERVPGVVAVSAGTADLPVAEEAALCAETMGNQVERIWDVGIAGLHRLLDVLPRLRQARAIVVAAGMDGALPAVVSGFVAVPVIALPTSVGYGVGHGGVAALLTMLNACAPGVAVVNIDNGFGAAVLASMINRGRTG